MNIAIVGDSVGLKSAGSLVATWRLAVSLSKKGHKVVLITTCEKKSFFIDEGVRVYTIKARKTPFLDGSWRVPLFPSKKEIKNILLSEKIDITHVVIPTPLCLKAINVSRKIGLPVVSHFHTQPENLLVLLRLKSRIFKDIFYKHSIWFYKKSDILICPSEFALDQIKNYSEKINCKSISNGINLSEFYPKKVNKDFLKKFKIKNQNKKILFVGRLWPEKNIKTLIKAIENILKKNKKTTLFIVGKKERQYEYLSKLVKQKSLEKNIIFTGRVSQEDLLNFYNVCDVFCLPSIAELEGLVVLEAMACGKPLVISDSKHSASKYFVNGNGLLFKTQDPSDLAEKLLYILNNPALANKMGKESLKIVKDYEINKCLEKVLKIYNSLL